MRIFSCASAADVKVPSAMAIAARLVMRSNVRRLVESMSGLPRVSLLRLFATMNVGRFLVPALVRPLLGRGRAGDLTQQAPSAFLLQWTDPAKDWIVLVDRARCV